MTDETLSATTTIAAPAETVFAVLADPGRHAAIDGTGWVREPHDGEQLTASGQVFRVAMYHPDHPDGTYDMANVVRAFEAPHAISWEPGQDTDGGTIEFGGWIWRYDLAPAGDGAEGALTEGALTEVTLTYDWSAVPAGPREYIAFPPFGVDHLERSLRHLAELAV